MRGRLIMDYKDINLDYIINYCKEHGEVEWLKKVAAKKVDYKVYPKKTIFVDGKKKTVADKEQPYKIEKRPISFIQIKMEFVDKFMPEIKPIAKGKKPTMYDIIKNL